MTTDSYTLALENLRATLAASATWQAFCGAGSAAAAATRIYPYAIPEPEDAAAAFTKTELIALRPYIVITPVAFSRQAVAVTDADDYTAAGTLVAQVVGNVDGTKNLQENYSAFGELVGGLIDDLANLSGQPGMLSIETITSPDNIMRGSENIEKTEGPFLIAFLEMDWSGI